MSSPVSVKTLGQTKYQEEVAAIRQWLLTEFGLVSACARHADLVMPPSGAIIDVMEPVRTCQNVGTGLKTRVRADLEGVETFLLPGRYAVWGMEEGEHSHWAVMSKVGSGQQVRFCFGWSTPNNYELFDWRHVRRADES